MNQKITRFVSYFIVAVLVICLIPANTYSAKKPALNKKRISLQQDSSYKLKIKKGKKKASVKWSVANKNIVKITKKKKSYAIIKGNKIGKTKVTALYKFNGKKTKLTCKVTVTERIIEDMPSIITNSPAPVVTQAPTIAPSPTPVPTPTPIPFENLVEVNELAESKTIPDIFTYIDGTPVTAENWEGRAEEIRQMYQYYMYGMWRNGEGESLTYEKNNSDLKINIETDGSQIGQTAGGSASFTVTVNIPSGNAPEKGWPVIISMGNLTEQETALANGYAVINYDTSQVSTDSAERKGAFYTLYPYNAGEWREQTGVLMAWAWGASKILDALYTGAGTDYNINSDFAIVGGVSRWGKATAVTGAFDKRFKIALPTCSGSGGMGVFRYNPNAVVTQTYDVSSLGFMSTVTYKQGDVETIGSLQSSGEAYWFNERFKQFRSVYLLPFDQHYLTALYAEEGRTCMLIGGFNFDVWQNTPSLWYNFQKAKQVFDMLNLSNNLIINLHDASMGHNILNDDVVKLFKYCDEMYNGIDIPDFSISDLQTTLFELTETPAGINNKEVYEAVLLE
ncbi:MAG: hypothetical protein E7267_01900 [Lachnospiraceae bacterium]|nr:hypothetical protein [Lachnospiraceae bacterium]